MPSHRARWGDDDSLHARAKRIRLVLTDCDGVLTDAGVYVTPGGEELKRFNVRDGHGFARLRQVGVRAAFLSGEPSEAFRHRAEKVGAAHYLGIRDKLGLLPVILDDFELESLSEVAFIGDDENDHALMGAVYHAGLTATPRDAERMMLGVAHLQTARRGGHGAFRDFVEWLIDLAKGGDGRER